MPPDYEEGGLGVKRWGKWREGRKEMASIGLYSCSEKIGSTLTSVEHNNAADVKSIYCCSGMCGAGSRSHLLDLERTPDRKITTLVPKVSSRHH